MTADRKADQLPTTVTGEPVASLAPGPLSVLTNDESIQQEAPSGEDDISGQETHEGIMELDDHRRNVI